jgi:hypothetical protein
MSAAAGLNSCPCSGGVYPRQDDGAYHLYSHLAHTVVENGVARRLGGDKPRHNIFDQSDRPEAQVSILD